MGCTNAITQEKVELGNAKEALRVLKERASADSSVTHCAMEDRDCEQGQLMTTSALLLVGKGALISTFGHSKQQASIVQLGETAVQERMKFSSWNYIYKVSHQVKQRNEAYQLKANRTISSFGDGSDTIHSKYVCQIFKHLHMIHQCISDSGKGPCRK